MPYGERRVKCSHCLNWYTCGDCVTHCCDDCGRAGHRGWAFLECPVCLKDAAERRARVDAAKAAKAADPYQGMCDPGTHRWKSRLISTPDVYEWETWCGECGCQHDPREGD